MTTYVFPNATDQIKPCQIDLYLTTLNRDSFKETFPILPKFVLGHPHLFLFIIFLLALIINMGEKSLYER